jgi:TonB family protein
MMLPKPPAFRIQNGFIVSMPPGGGGVPNPAPASGSEMTPVAPETAKPPKVLKPPMEQLAPRHGLPELGSHPSRKATPAAAASGFSSGTGTTPGIPGIPGLEFGPGVPGGTDPYGDLYLAGIQRKIWMIWVQQLRSEARSSAVVSFTILKDGSVTDVRLVQSSGVTLIDLAAQRSVVTAAPFSPLPERYGTNQFPIQAIFKPSL